MKLYLGTKRDCETHKYNMEPKAATNEARPSENLLL
jgi:hypothetical protein